MFLFCFVSQMVMIGCNMGLESSEGSTGLKSNLASHSMPGHLDWFAWNRLGLASHLSLQEAFPSDKTGFSHSIAVSYSWIFTLYLILPGWVLEVTGSSSYHILLARKLPQHSFFYTLRVRVITEAFQDLSGGVLDPTSWWEGGKKKL